MASAHVVDDREQVDRVSPLLGQVVIPPCLLEVSIARLWFSAAMGGQYSDAAAGRTVVAAAAMG